MKNNNLVSTHFHTLFPLPVNILVIFATIFTLTNADESMAEVLAPEGQTFCYEKQTGNLFYRRMIVYGSGNRVHDSFTSEGEPVFEPRCYTETGPLNDYYYAPSKAIRYSAYVCSDDNKKWHMWYGYLMPAYISSEEADYMSTITSSDPPDDSICDCWFDYLIFEKDCVRWGSGDVQWDFETCSGICCPPGGCPENEVDADKNFGRSSSKCE